MYYLAGITSPKEYFDASDRALLRFGMANSRTKWVDLPGPATAWPSSKEPGSASWYLKAGFAPRVTRIPAYKKAWKALEKGRGPQGWWDYMVHERDPDEVIWDRYL